MFNQGGSWASAKAIQEATAVPNYNIQRECSWTSMYIGIHSLGQLPRHCRQAELAEMQALHHMQACQHCFHSQVYDAAITLTTAQEWAARDHVASSRSCCSAPSPRQGAPYIFIQSVRQDAAVCLLQLTCQLHTGQCLRQILDPCSANFHGFYV